MDEIGKNEPQIDENGEIPAAPIPDKIQDGPMLDSIQKEMLMEENTE